MSSQVPDHGYIYIYSTGITPPPPDPPPQRLVSPVVSAPWRRMFTPSSTWSDPSLRTVTECVCVGGGGGAVTERYRGGGVYGRGIVYTARSVIEEDPSPSVCPVCREYPLLRAARAARV